MLTKEQIFHDLVLFFFFFLFPAVPTKCFVQVFRVRSVQRQAGFPDIVDCAVKIGAGRGEAALHACSGGGGRM